MEKEQPREDSAPTRGKEARHLQVAEELGQDAQFLVQNLRYRSAVDRAYFSAFHAAGALSRALGLDSPCCEDYVHIIETWERAGAFRKGRIPREARTLLRDLWDSRQLATDSVDSTLSPDAAADAVQDALLFVAQVRHKLEEWSKQT